MNLHSTNNIKKSISQSQPTNNTKTTIIKKNKDLKIQKKIKVAEN